MTIDNPHSSACISYRFCEKYGSVPQSPPASSLWQRHYFPFVSAWRKCHQIGWLLLVVAVFSLTPARAQEAGGGDPALGSSQKTADTTSVGDLLQHSGPVVWICMVLSVLVMSFTIEGFIKLRYPALCPPPELAYLQALMRELRYQEAWEFCQGRTSFLCTVVRAGLERIGRGSEATEYTLQEVASQQAVVLKTNAHYLSAIGVVAPMIGLSGTVIGMIKAFKQLGSSISGDPAGLAAAIGEVLTATAAGLLVAIPGFIFYYVLKARAQTAIMLADSEVYHLFEDVPFDQLTGVKVGVAAQNAAMISGEFEEPASQK